MTDDQVKQLLEAAAKNKFKGLGKELLIWSWGSWLIALLIGVVVLGGGILICALNAHLHGY